MKRILLTLLLFVAAKVYSQDTTWLIEYDTVKSTLLVSTTVSRYPYTISGYKLMQVTGSTGPNGMTVQLSNDMFMYFDDKKKKLPSTTLVWGAQ